MNRKSALLAALVVVACDGGVAPVLPVATTITIEGGALAFSALGTTRQISVTVRDQSGDPLAGAATAWSTSNGSVVTVSEAGRVTAIGNGGARLTVVSGSASAGVDATVAQVASSLTLTHDTATFASLGDTVRVGASVLDAGGSAVQGAVVAWASLQPAVATVSPEGLVAAVSNGSTLVVAATSGLLVTALVRVAQTPADLSVSADSVRLESLGDTVLLAASVSDAGGSAYPDALVVWTSSDANVATVSARGVVRAVDNGVVAVTATAGSVMAETVVTVEQVVALITLMPDSIVLSDLAETVPVVATARDALGSEVAAPGLVWASTNPTVATVDSAGVVTAVGTGTAAITAGADGVLASVDARVVPALALLPAGPTALVAEVATAVSLSVRVEDVAGPAYAGATVTWSVTGGGGAIQSAAQTVSDPSGHAGAVWTLGTATVAQGATATLVSRGTTLQVAFTASPLPGPAVDATLVADSVLLSAVGETVFLGPTLRDRFGNVATAPAVAWASTDPAVVGVSADGLVTGQAAGSAYVRASLTGPTDSILVTVVPRGAITITFDDGWLDTYTEAWPVMEEFGLVGNVAVYTEPIGVFPAYMNQAQLGELHDAGWTLVAHTVSHDSLTLLSDAVLDYELRAGRQWLVDRGFARGADILVVPYHVWTQRERNAAAQYYRVARGTPAGLDSLVTWMPPNPYELTGVDLEALDFTTENGRNLLRGMLQRTLAEGRFLDVVFHQMPSANVDALRATLTVIDEFRDRVLPYHRLYPTLARGVF